MGMGAMLRPVLRLARTVPGYRAVRRRVVTGMRGSATVRRASRAAYPDLLDAKQVATQRAEALKNARTEHRAEMHEQRVRHSTRMKQVLREHKEQVQRIRRDAARAEDRRRRALPPVSAGDLVAGLYLADRPLILCDVQGMDETTAAEVLEEIAREQVLGCAFRPMFLTDGDGAVWRRYGHLCEVIPSDDGWTGDLPFTDYLAARLESIRADLGAGWWLQVPPTGLTDTQRAFLRRCGR